MQPNKCLSVLLILAALLGATPASADMIAGVPIGTSYYGANSLVLWRVDASSVTELGKVGLQSKLGFGSGNITFYDVTFLSDGRVAILYNNTGGTRTVSVLTLVMSGTTLSDVNVDASFTAYDGSHTAPTKIGGTTRRGIVTASTGQGVARHLYLFTNPSGSSSWSAANWLNPVLDNTLFDITGITESSRETVVASWYGGHTEYANVSGVFQKVKTYIDSTYGPSVEGIRDTRLADGWFSSGSHPGSWWHTLVMDQNDSSTTVNQCRGRITNGPDPNPPARPPNNAGVVENRIIGVDLAGLNGGRAVLMGGAASTSSKTFDVYSLEVNRPSPGELGATNKLVSVKTPGSGGSDGRFHGYIAGDFIVAEEPRGTMVVLR